MLQYRSSLVAPPIEKPQIANKEELHNHLRRNGLVVKKRVINNDGNTKSASDFTILVTGKTVALEAGPHSVSEIQDNDYTSTFSPDCSGTINSGQSKNCVVTNDDKGTIGTLIVKKHVVNDNEGDKQASDFTIHVTGNNPITATFACPTQLWVAI